MRRDLESEGLPVYVWAVMAAAAYVLLFVTACTSDQRPLQPDHYGWSAPQIMFEGEPPSEPKAI